MRRKSSLLILIVVFLLGAWTSYYLCKFDFLEIDPKINVSTTLISLATAIIGLYIAISLKKNQTKSSNLHNYLQPKLDAVWKLFLTLSHKISVQEKMELKEANRSFKEISVNLSPLKKMFSTFNLNSPCLKELETAIDDLEEFLGNNCKIENNIMNYGHQMPNLRLRLDYIHEKFAKALIEINKIS